MPQQTWCTGHVLYPFGRTVFCQMISKKKKLQEAGILTVQLLAEALLLPQRLVCELSPAAVGLSIRFPAPLRTATALMLSRRSTVSSSGPHAMLCYDTCEIDFADDSSQRQYRRMTNRVAFQGSRNTCMSSQHKLDGIVRITTIMSPHELMKQWLSNMLQRQQWHQSQRSMGCGDVQ